MIKALKRFLTGGGGKVNVRNLAGSRQDPPSPPAFKPETKRLKYFCPKCYQPIWKRYAPGKFSEHMQTYEFLEIFCCFHCGYGEQ